MKRRPFNLTDAGKLSAGGGGGGWMKPTPPIVDSTTRQMNQLQQSVKDRGGYPTRNGVPLKTKMQERAEQRKAGVKFRKGGMVKGGCRDYGK